MPTDHRHAAHVCTACGVTCDDLVIGTNGDQIGSVDRACDGGRRWWLAQHVEPAPPTVGGNVTSLEEACGVVAELIGRSDYPLITGLATCSTEAQRAAVALADHAGAVVDWTTGPADGAAALSMQTVGAVTASWGEVAQRADMVVYWASDPDATHPRMAERYTEQPTSRWLPNGRDDRHVVVVDDRPNTTAARADGSLQVATENHYVSLSVLRAVVREVVIDANAATTATGVALDDWRRLADRMRSAKFGAVVAGKRLAADGPESLSALAQLMVDLTRHTRWVTIGEGGAGNATGAANVMAWQAGAPMAVDFSQRAPRYRPLECAAATLIARGECTTTVEIFGSDGKCRVTAQSAGDDASAVVIPTATPGVDVAGTTYRGDGVALPQRATIATVRPATEDVLDRITQLLDANC